MEIFPAIDIISGGCVRLEKGDFNKVDSFPLTPEAQAQEFKKQGFKNLHIVDLDAAKSGGSKSNIAHIKAICALGLGLNVQVGGGVRSLQDADTLAQAGVNSFIIGTTAVQNPQEANSIIQKYPNRVLIGVDSANNKAAVSGWLEESTTTIEGLISQYNSAPILGFVYTDINRDGTLSGPNTQLFTQVKQASQHNVIVAGGIASTEDLQTLRELGAYGAIVGKALYTGAISAQNLSDFL